MPSIYVRSVTGLDSNDGSTWALAKATLSGASGAASVDAAGDTIFLASDHIEDVSGSFTIALASTAAIPAKVICAADLAEPPAGSASTALVAVDGNLVVSGNLWSYGVSYSCGTGSNTGGMTLCSGTETQTYVAGTFTLRSTGNTAINLGTSGGNYAPRVKLSGCNVKLSGVGQRLQLYSNFVWDGGTMLAGTVATSIFRINGRNASTATVSGVDFSSMPTALNLVDGSGIGSGRIMFRNCRLPASWTGSLWSTVPAAMGMRAEMHNCDSAGTNYRMWVEDYAGSTKSETALVKTGGASDGVTPISWNMTTSANASYPATPLESPELSRWNAVVGSPITVTVDILNDSATGLTNADIWIEVQYAGNSAYPVTSFINNAKSDVMAVASDHTASSATWTITGMVNPNTQKLAVTFTPQAAGYLQARVFVAKPSTTIYVDPKLQVT